MLLCVIKSHTFTLPLMLISCRQRTLIYIHSQKMNKLIYSRSPSHWVQCFFKYGVKSVQAMKWPKDTLTDALVCELCVDVLEKENYVNNRKVNHYQRVIKFLHSLRNRAHMIWKSFKPKTVTLQASALHNLQCLLIFIPWYDGAFVMKKKL